MTPATGPSGACEVLDPVPPRLRGRGAARTRAADLAGHDGTVASEVLRRGLVRRSLLRRIGVGGEPPPGAVAAGDTVLSAGRATLLREALLEAVRAAGPEGLAPGAAARAVGVDDIAVVGALATPPLRVRAGRVGLDDGDVARLPEADRRALDHLAADLEDDPFTAPTAERLRSWG